MEKKNVMKRIVEDFKVLSEEFQVLADDFNILLKFEEMYGNQGYKGSEQEKSQYSSGEYGQMGEVSGNNIENSGQGTKNRQPIELETGRGIEEAKEKGPGESSNYTELAASGAHPAAKRDYDFTSENKADDYQTAKRYDDFTTENKADIYQTENKDDDFTSQNKEDSSKSSDTAKNEDKEITIETVRSLLLQKTRSGKVNEIKELIKKYGAGKLTDLNPSCYKELLKEAENI